MSNSLVVLESSATAALTGNNLLSASTVGRPGGRGKRKRVPVREERGSIQVRLERERVQVRLERGRVPVRLDRTGWGAGHEKASG